MIQERARPLRLCPPNRLLPLLGEHSSSETAIDSDVFRISNLRDRRARTIIALLCGSTIGTTSVGFFQLSGTRLVEAVLCREYYDEHRDQLSGGPIDERLCKVDSVQEQMAYIFGAYFAIRAIVSLTVAFPWAMVADRIGRRPVAVIAIIGFLLDMSSFSLICRFSEHIPVKFVSLTPIATILGGANPTLIAIMLSICADTVPESSRGTAFLYTHVAGMFGTLVSPALAGFLMQRTGVWQVVLTGLILALVCLCFYAFIIPETLKRPAHSKQHQATMSAASDSEGSKLSWATIKSQLRNLAAHLKESTALLKPASLAVLVGLQIINFPITQSTGQFLNQFASKRYDISIAQTGYLGSLYGIAHIVVAVVIVPTLSTWLLKTPFFTADPTAIRTEVLSRPTSSSSSSTVTPMTPEDAEDTHHKQKHNHRYRDLLLARGSYFVLVLAFILMGAAPTLAAFIVGLLVLSLGSAFNSLTRAISSIYVDDRLHTRLFSLLGISEEIGMVWAQPFLAELFAVGMRRNKDREDLPWIGLPYFGVAILCALGAVLLFFIHLPRNTSFEEEPLLSGDTDIEDTM